MLLAKLQWLNSWGKRDCKMNVLFMTLVAFDSLSEQGIYTDLLREFVKHGHEVFVISPIERRHRKESYIVTEDHATILRLKTGNTQKTNLVEKGISTILIEPLFIAGIKKYFSKTRFDLVLYSTPPITLVSAVNYVKKRDGARSYLLLKDIFPQNAVDLGMIRKKGIKSIIYKHFRKQEIKLYKISDKIGCMSQANVEYIISNNTFIDSQKVEVCPNSIEVIDKSIDENTRIKIRNKYCIPTDKTVYVYGGNLGKPQGIPFLIECLKECESLDKVYFLIVGDGTEYTLINDYINSSKQNNVKLMRSLPKEDYDTLVAACDVGMIFLDNRFTIPNFPSRILSYMQARLPILAATDKNTDVGKMLINYECGWWVESFDAKQVFLMIKGIEKKHIEQRGRNSYKCLEDNYNVEDAYDALITSII